MAKKPRNTQDLTLKYKQRLARAIIDLGADHQVGTLIVIPQPFWIEHLGGLFDLFTGPTSVGPSNIYHVPDLFLL